MIPSSPHVIQMHCLWIRLYDIIPRQYNSCRPVNTFCTPASPTRRHARRFLGPFVTICGLPACRLPNSSLIPFESSISALPFAPIPSLFPLHHLQAWKHYLHTYLASLPDRTNDVRLSATSPSSKHIWTYSSPNWGTTLFHQPRLTIPQRLPQRHRIWPLGLQQASRWLLLHRRRSRNLQTRPAVSPSRHLPPLLRQRPRPRLRHLRRYPEAGGLLHHP